MDIIPWIKVRLYSHFHPNIFLDALICDMSIQEESRAIPNMQRLVSKEDFKKRVKYLNENQASIILTRQVVRVKP